PCAAEIGQINDEGRGHDLAAGFAQKVDGGGGRAAGCDQIIDQENLIARPYRVGVNLDRVDAVFERIFLADDAGGQLALLANRHEAAAELMGDGAAENEAARLYTGHVADVGVQKWPHQLVDGSAEGVIIGQERGDV